MTTSILSPRFLIANSSTHICVSAVIPKPDLVNTILIVLLVWTMVALAITGLGSLVSLFLISTALAVNWLALNKAIRESRHYDYRRSSTH